MVEENQIISWGTFVRESEELILKAYDGLKTPSAYRGDWKHYFRTCAQTLKIQIVDDVYDHWGNLTVHLQRKGKEERSSNAIQRAPSPSITRLKSSSSGSKSNYMLSSDEKERIIQYMESIEERDKWRLESGRFVEDQMLLLIKKSCYAHPVHSLIMDPSDKIWGDFFTKAELNEIRLTNIKALPKLSEEMTETLDKYDVEGMTPIEMYQFADEVKAHPIDEADKSWVKESIKSACELFFKNDELVVEDFSETDFLVNIWEFAYKLQKTRSIKAKLGERVSKAVSLGRNAERTLEVVERRPRKAMGAKLDILFKAGIYELGSCEIGKHDVEEIDDKYINDGLLKTPKTLKDMLAMQVRSNPCNINSLVTVGYVMMGLHMELVMLDIPEGKNVARVRKTDRFPFPCTSEGLSTDFVSLLELTWRGSQMMEETFSLLKKRKRKEIEVLTRV